MTSGAATADGLLLGWTAEAAVATGEGESLGADSAVATGAVAIDGLVGTQAAITRVRLASTRVIHLKYVVTPRVVWAGRVRDGRGSSRGAPLPHPLRDRPGGRFVAA